MTGTGVIIVGGGVIGLAVAWRAAQDGRSVVVVDPQPGRGASWTAAGMLAPATELYYGERELYGLNRASADSYPAFVQELESSAGMAVGYRTEGTILAAWDAADLAQLADLHAFHRSLGIATDMLTSRELRRLEPGTAPGLPGALFAPDDHQVDNRLLHQALRKAAERTGARVVAGQVRALRVEHGRARGVFLDDGGALDADQVVLAGGAWSRGLDGIPEPLLPPVRPVKGQTLRIRAVGESPLTRTVRAKVKGISVYIVPRSDSQLVIGASSEETGFGVEPRVGAIHDLLRDAIAVVPELAEAVWVEVSTSLRPGTPDNGPLIGASGLDGLIVATGHYRNGILLTPITAAAVAALLRGDAVPAPVGDFAADRFVRSGTVAE